MKHFTKSFYAYVNKHFTGTVCHSRLINRHKIVVVSYFQFFKAVFVQSNYMGAQYTLEQEVLNK